MKSSPSISKSLASTMNGKRGMERRKPIWGERRTYRKQTPQGPPLCQGATVLKCVIPWALRLVTHECRD